MRFEILQRAAALLLVLSLAACDTGPAESLYDPDFEGAPDPVVTGIEPSGSALAGVSEIVIRGENFGSDPDAVRVYFGDTRAELLEASPTQLRVRAPNLTPGTVNIRVSVVGALDLSNPMPYALEAAVADFGDIKTFEEPFGIASDAAGNLYVSLFSTNVSAGIKRITPEGERSDYISTTFKWEDLAFGPDGGLYGVRGVRAAFRFPPGGGPQETWAVIPDNSARLTAIDFDADGHAWLGGTGGNLWRVSPGGDIKSFAFAGSIRDLKAWAGSLYVAATRDGISQIWRLPFAGPGEVATPEVFFDVSGQHGGARAAALAFADNGELFIGTDASDPVLVVAPDGSAEVLFPGVITPAATGLAWGPGSTLYMARRLGDGSEDATLLQINTLRDAGR